MQKHTSSNVCPWNYYIFIESWLLIQIIMNIIKLFKQSRSCEQSKNSDYKSKNDFLNNLFDQMFCKNTVQ